MTNVEILRTILIFGEFDMPNSHSDPLNFFLFRYPTRGAKWHDIMKAVRNFLRDNYGEKARNGRVVAPFFNVDVDGNVPDWDTTKFPRYEYVNGELISR